MEEGEHVGGLQKSCQKLSADCTRCPGGVKFRSDEVFSHHSIQRVMLGNTFPPNDIIARNNHVLGALLPFLPESLILSTVRKSFVNSIYPAAGNSEIVLAFLMGLPYGRMSKAQFIARYCCVIDPFSAPDPRTVGIPIMIVEADNDPLVEETLREQLKATYPSATVHTLPHVGHFPYLNGPSTYTHLIQRFLEH